jgi:Uma2 family endonuclease
MGRAWYNMAIMVDVVAESWRGRYVREPRPLFFPTTKQVPETRRHYELRTALFQTLQAAFGDRATLGCDQFLYWNPREPKACLAPDVFVRVGEPDAAFDSWKIWERGAPHLAVEVLSKSDAEDWSWEQKFERYAQTGIQELVSFDADRSERPLRIWDLFEGDLVERDPRSPDFLTCRALGVFFCLREDPKLGLLLGIARDRDGKDPLLTPDEARQRADDARQRADDARQRAEARVRELEAELARRGG